MSEQPFAEATVRVTPSLTRFVTDLDKELKKAMLKVKTPVVRVKPGLSIGFIGSLRTQVNDAITRVQGQVKPIRVRVLIEAPSRRALQEVVKGAPVTLPGAVTAGVRGPGVVQEAENLRLINQLNAEGAHDFSLRAAAEAEAAKVREKAVGTSKKLVTEEQKVAKSGQLVAEIRKRTALIDTNAATKTGELAKAQAALTEAIKLADLADQARALNVTQETVDLQKQAHAVRSLRLERVESIEAAKKAGAGTGAAGATAAQKTAIDNARKSADATKTVVAGLRETDVVAKTLGGSTADLAGQQALLKKQSALLTVANKNVTASLTSENQVVRAAALSAQQSAQVQVNATNQQIEAIKRLQRVEQTHAASRKAQARAAAAEASAGRRRSEQLSRGGQASILSLAGIRGATLAASRSFLVGAAAITVFARAVKQFADLERNLHVFEATVSATETEMKAVREEARLLGADLTLPSVTAGDAAGAMVELAKAGLTVQDSIDGARAVLELATAAAIDNAEATRLVANVLNAFSLSGREAVNVADTLANAANAAQGSIADIGTAFQQAASAGRQVGLSFQDTAVFLTILAKNGIRGSDAGTSLRTALIRLINPSKKAKETFKELGISIHDAAGNLRPDIFLQIAAATNEMSAAERDATIALIGGQDAFRAVTILGRQSVESFIAMRRALREEGTAAELAAARTKGLHGSIDALQSVLETVGTTMASHVGPGIAGFVYQLGRGVTAMSESNDLAKALEGTLEAVATSFNLLGDAIKAVSVVALPLVGLLLKLANAIGPTTILAGVVAYKSLNAVLDGTIFRLKILRPLFGAIASARLGVVLAEVAVAATQAKQAATTAAVAAPGLVSLARVQDNTNKQMAAAVPRAVAYRTALRGVGQAALAAATSGNALVIAVAAAAAAIVFFATRASATEKATKRLAQASRELADALGKVNDARSESVISGASVNLAQEGINEAKAAAAAAKSALVNSAAAKGTFERKKQELALAIALDNVLIAEQRYADAVRQAEVDKDAAVAASERLQDARTKELRSIKALVKAELQRGVFAARASGRVSEKAGALAELVARERIIKKIREQALENRKSEDENVRALGKREQLFVQLAKAMDSLPTFSQRQVIFDFELPNAAAVAQKLKEQFAKAGNAAGVAAMESILLGLGVLPENLKDFIDASVSPALREAMSGAADVAGKGAGEKMAQSMAAAFAAAMKRSEIQRGFLDTAEDLAVIASGATGATLSVAQDRLAQAIADRARAEARIADLEGRAARKGRGTISGLETARKERARAIAEQRAATEEIRGINDQLDSEAEAAANEAEAKQNKIFENILKAMGLKRDARQRAIEDAQLSEGLADDIRATQILRKVAAQQIKTLKDRIAAAKKQGLNVDVLKEGLKDLTDKWLDLGREILKLRKEQQEALHDILLERFELKISIAQSRENVVAELRARRAKLKELTRELVRMRKQFGLNSIEWLRAKNAQVEEIAKIRELEGTTKTKNNALKKLMFEFLTTQQGFAANLLGNLLPIGAIGGTVGARMDARSGGGGGGGGGNQFGPALGTGRGPDGRQVVPKRTGSAFAATAGVGAIATPTRGQASTTNQLLHQILNVLRNSNQREKNPSSRRQQKTGGSSNDTE